MMKRWTALLTVLVLLCTAAWAFGDTGASPDLYDVYEETAEGRNWIGNAIPIVDGVSVTSTAWMPEQAERMLIWDGTAFRDVVVALSTAEGSVAVLLHETDGEKPAIPAYDLLETSRTLQAGNLIVRSGDRMGSRINRAVDDISFISWKNREAMLLTLSGDTSVGAPVITADGKLAGIVTAEYAEGINRYVALTVSEIAACLTEADRLLNAPEAGSAPEGYKVTAEANLVTFDWSGMKLPEAGEGEKLYHIVADAESSYLTYAEITKGMTDMTLLLVPGRTYVSGIGAYSAAPSILPDQLAVTVLPEAEPLKDYEFRSQAFAIADRAPDAPKDAMPVAAEEISETFLRSGRACIYSLSSYKVDSDINDCTLLIALTAPNGNCYRYTSTWLYLTEYMDKDEWYVTMDETGLLQMLNNNGYPEGTYTMAMYIGGKLADSFSFTLIK